MPKPNLITPPEKIDLTLGYLRLTDSAPLIMAKEMGFFEQFGLKVELVREISWANTRDKLIAGVFDAVSMLAPLPLTTSLGLGGVRESLITGLILSLNGNAITLSSSIYMHLDISVDEPDPIKTAQALKAWVDDTGTKLTMGTVHTTSCHTLHLRRWLELGGLVIDTDVQIVVLPPEQMADNLANGMVDGFCVGSPWNVLSVQRGIGTVVATGYDMWNNAPEKALVVTERWHEMHPVTHLRLRMALMACCEWLASSSNRTMSATVMARTEYLNLPESTLLPSLTGNMVFSRGREPASLPHFHIFHRYHAGFPWHSDAMWMLENVLRQSYPNKAIPALEQVIQQVFRTDLYRQAAASLQWASPSVDERPLAHHDTAWTLEAGIELGADRIIGLHTNEA